jgi:hypothetical protein
MDWAGDLPWLEDLLGVSDGRPGWLDNVFVTSFCEEPDLLSQWRGLAVGGFAVGFAAEDLATPAKSLEQASLVRVDYGRDHARPRLRQRFEELASGGHIRPPSVSGWRGRCCCRRWRA